MALDGLLEALRRQSQQEREAVLCAAREEAERIRSAARSAFEQRRGFALDERRAALRGALEVQVGDARRRARAAELAARQRFLDRVFAAAAGGLKDAVNGEAWRRELPAQLERALRCVGDEPVTITCPEKVAPLVRALVKGRAGTTVCADAKGGAGLRITTHDGLIEVDDTLEGRLERQRPRLMLLVISSLNGTA